MWRLVYWVGCGACLLLACGGVSSKSRAGGGGSASGGSTTGTAGQGASGIGGQAGTAGATTDPCITFAQEYARAIDRARNCEAGHNEQCSEVVPEGLECACPTFVNPQNAEAYAQAEDLRASHAGAGCAPTPNCGVCPQATGAVCNGIGRCISIPGAALGAACQVDGVTYQSGSEGIPSPRDCNTCSCRDGSLACTLIACDSEPCPAGQVDASQCLQCGELGCSLVEYGCLPTCHGSCDGAACVDGVCKVFCD